MTNVNNKMIMINHNGNQQVYISSDEHQELIKENEELKTTIMTLKGNERILQEILEDNKKTMDNNKETIEELKQKNKELKEEIKQLQNTVNEHEKTITKITIKHNELKVEHNELKGRFDKLENKILIKKYLIAIQDLNDKEQLERQTTGQELRSFRKIRNKRTTGCHYLEYTMSQIEKDNRLVVFRNNLANMPDSLKIYFDKTFPGVRNILPNYLPPQSVCISSQDEDDINGEFWDDE
jgi:chromosome segregation ATPase